MDEEARDYVIDFIASDERYREVLPVASESVVSAALGVQDAIVDWMGPGGDLAFLDFYVIAGGRMDALMSLSHRHLSADGRPSRWSNPRYLLWGNICSSLANRRLIASQVPRAGLLHGHSPMPDPALADEIIEAVARTLSVGSREWKDIVQLQRSCAIGPFFSESRGSWTKQRHRDVYLSVGLVSLDYRTILMGELASPWEILKPPFDRGVSPSLR